MARHTRNNQARNALAYSTAMIALMAAAPVLAQTAPAPDKPANNAAPKADEIVVTGFRAGLQRSEAVKQNATSVVEALSSEDIGKLPEASIADSLGRLAGLAGERLAGRVSGLSVRGFKEDYVGTTLNGRDLIGIGDNRGVEYDLYPAEIMNGAEVYKTPNASLNVMGVGGTVDLQTIKPLEHKRVLTINGSLEQNGETSNNPDFSNRGYRVAATYVDKFANDTIGLALTGAITSSPTQDEYSGIWGYSNTAVTSGPNAGKWAPSGIQITSDSEVLKRDTISGVLEWKPDDKLTATFDGLYINFSDTGISRGFIEALPLDPTGAGVISANSTTITSAKTTGFNSVIRNDPLNKTGKLKVFGGNFKYAASDSFHVSLDLSHSDSNKSDARDETYSGLGRAGTPTQGANDIRTYSYTPNGLQFSNSSTAFGDYSQVKLAGPQSWGGTLAPLGAPGGPLYNGPNATVGFAQAQDGFINDALFHEYLNAIHADFKKDFAEGFIKNVSGGLRYASHQKSKLNQGYFLTASTYPLDGAIPTGSRAGVASLAWAGLGNVVAYNALGLINSATYTKYNDTQLEPDRAGDSYTIHETTFQPFIETEFDKHLSNGVRVFGNAGLQGKYTKQHGSGFNSYTGANLYDIATPVSDGASYWRVLPSVNLNFDLTNGHMLRLAAAKVTSAPRIDSLNPGSAVAFKNNVANVTSTDPAQGPWYSTGGNAQLRPYEATQLDLSYEWYFARDGFVSASLFYKHLDNWNELATTIRDYTQFYIPGYDQAVSSDGKTIYTPATFKGVNTGYVGGLKGSDKGVEIQATLPLGRITPLLKGFGLVGGMAYNDGSLDDGTRIPGLSKYVYQATAFYENGGFAARVSGNRRSSWLSEDRGGSNTLTPVDRAAETLVDAQLSYDFKNSGMSQLRGLKLSIQGQNLTNQQDTYTDSSTGLVLRNEQFGRNFMLNATFSFF